MSSATNTRLPEFPQGPRIGTRTVLERAGILPSLEMRDMNKSRLITVGSAAAVLALTAGAASAASSMITSKDIRDGAVHRADLSKGVVRDLDKAQGLNGPIYRIAHYHDGAAAGRSPRSPAPTTTRSRRSTSRSPAVSRSSTPTGTRRQQRQDLAVSDSFPGRMDWTTNTPQAEPARRLGRPLGRRRQVHPQGQRLGGLCEAVGQREGPDHQLLIVHPPDCHGPLPRLRPGQRQVRTGLRVRRGRRGRCWRRTGRPPPARRRRDGRRH